MKKLITAIILLFLLNNCFATNYYITASGSNTTGLSPANGWTSIAKLNSSFASINAGDSVLFNRGEVFYGSVVIGKSGSAGNPIKFGAFGTGAAPVISGFTTLSGWTNAGGGIWNLTVSNIKSSVNMVSLNGVAQEVGRWPNSDASNAGYLTASGFSGNTQYTCAALNGTNWTGAEVVARLRGYLFERNRITAQSGSTITYARYLPEINTHHGGSSSPTTPPDVGFGLFIQRDIRTLDKLGEWFVDSTTKLFSMYFGATVPTSYTVKASTLDTGFNIATRTNITITDLTIEGFNLAGVMFNDNSGITIKNCTINNTGCKAVYGWFSSGAIVDNNVITQAMCNAIDIEASPATTVRVTNNTISSMGLLKGMSEFYDPADCNAIFVGGNSIARFNSVDSVGYNGIRFEGQNINVDSNHVNHYCQVRNDGGGIYSQATLSANATVKNNIVENAGYPILGTQELVGSHGLYLDNGQGNTSVTNNTVANLPGVSFLSSFGMIMNSPQNNTFTNNIIYNANGWYIARQYAFSQNATTVTNNTFFCKSASQVAMLSTSGGLDAVTSYTSSSISNFLNQLGPINNNYYNCSGSTPFWYYYKTLHTDLNFTFPPQVNIAGWRSVSGRDAASTMNNVTGDTLITNPRSTTYIANFPGSSYVDHLTGTVYNNSVTIPAWSSKILLYNGSTVVTPPTANAGVDKTITLPTNSVSVTGIETAGTNPIASRSWQIISGPLGSTNSAPTSTTTTFGSLVQGTYTAVFTVTDNIGSTASDLMQITVNPAVIIHTPPIANAGGNKSITLPINSVSITGSYTVGTSPIVSTSWTVISGPAGSTNSAPASLTTTIGSLTVGTYTVRLKVLDNTGDSGIATMQITVNPSVNVAPVANAGADFSITLPTTSTTLSGSGTDIDGFIASQSWTQISGTAATITNGTTFTPIISGLTTTGARSFQLTVTDNNGLTAKDTVIVTVNPALVPPTANANVDQTITLPTNSVTMAGSGTNGSTSIQSALWTKTYGPATFTITTPASYTTTITGLVAGTYNFTLTVVDSNGLSGSDVMQVIVNPVPYVPSNNVPLRRRKKIAN